MKNIEYNSGDKVRNLTYLHDVEPYKYTVKATGGTGTDRRALFECYCGNKFETTIRAVRRGHTVSCGAHRAKTFVDLLTKHSMAIPGRKHPMYLLWQRIKTRCYNTESQDYWHYGGRGIVLSEEFHNPVSFYNYVSTLENYHRREELNLTIDRIDTNGNYERGNLRWATKTQQKYNQRHREVTPFLQTIVRYMETFKRS